MSRPPRATPAGDGRGAPAAPPEVDVQVDDLTFWEGEAIARPVTAELGATTALLRRLEVAAGPGLASQLRTGEPLAVGAAVVTGPGALRVDLVVHAVVSSREERVTRDAVRRATLSALQRAADFGIAHLALPPFGLGAGNLDIEDSARAMLDAVRTHAARTAAPRRITFVVETEDERRAFAVLLPKGEA